MSKIAVVGGGLAGVTAAWQLQRLGQPYDLFEASDRLGGTVKTIHRDGFTIELGPDGWVTEKPWAAQLVQELGLSAELLSSNDAERVTYILTAGVLQPMPDGMRMMVPADLAALAKSPLFSETARAAYASEIDRAKELRGSAPVEDESVASFVERHFGGEVLRKVAGPLLSGVFGGDVRTLSVRAVMPAFVEMERTHGSLVLALQVKELTVAKPVFTTLRGGTEGLVKSMVAALDPASVHLNHRVTEIAADGDGWKVDSCRFDAVILAAPVRETQGFLTVIERSLGRLLPVESTSAVIVAFAFDQTFPLPRGFGFLVPVGEGRRLLACTFVDQKFAGRVPEEKRLLRAFFGGGNAPEVLKLSDEEIARIAFAELGEILGGLPTPLFSVVERWPESLPQYAVGHLERMAELEASLPKGLYLLGNGYKGVGLPDLIRDARALGRKLAGLSPNAGSRRQ